MAEQIAEKDPQRVERWMRESWILSGTWQAPTSVSFHSFGHQGTRQFQIHGHPVPVVQLQQDQHHGEDQDDNHHNGGNDGSRTYEEERMETANIQTEMQRSIQRLGGGPLLWHLKSPLGQGEDDRMLTLMAGPRTESYLEWQCTLTPSGAWRAVSSAHRLPKFCLRLCPVPISPNTLLIRTLNFFYEKGKFFLII